MIMMMMILKFIPSSLHLLCTFWLKLFQVFASQWWNLPARNTLKPLLALYTDLRATIHNVTDRQTDGQMDKMVMPI